MTKSSEGLTEPIVSVLICAHNNADCIERCIGALARSEYKNLETIVFDDASTDETVALAEQACAELPGTWRVVRGNPNLGFTRACNEASLHANGEIVLLLNSDALVRPGAIGALTAALSESPRLGVAGATLRWIANTLAGPAWRCAPNCGSRPTDSTRISRRLTTRMWIYVCGLPRWAFAWR